MNTTSKRITDKQLITINNTIRALLSLVEPDSIDEIELNTFVSTKLVNGCISTVMARAQWDRLNFDSILSALRRVYEYTTETTPTVVYLYIKVE